MKIVSLQSVGLGNIGMETSERVFAKPIRYEVGEGVAKLGYLMTGNEPKVTKIEFGDLYHGMEMPRQDDTYFVYTSDGHIRVLPADKYIAEWSDDTDRISPDDIGNDIHEFLHGGDNKMEKLNEVQGYIAHWYGEDGDLTIGGIYESDMTQEELDSKRQSVTVYTKKQVMELLAKGDK